MEPRRADEREQLGIPRRLMEAGDQLFLRQGAFGKEGLHQLFVGFRHHLEQLLPRDRRGVGHLRRNVPLRHASAVVGGKGQRFHAYEIDDAVERALVPDGQLNRNDSTPAVAMQGLECPLEAGAIALQPADDDEAGELQGGGLGPELFGLHLDTGDRVDDDQGAFADAKRGAGISEEVGEAGRVDDVDFGVLPLGVGETGGECVLTGDFFVVEVGDGGAVVDLPDAVDRAGHEEHRGHQLCLAAPAVPDHRNVADAGRVIDLHTGYPSCPPAEARALSIASACGAPGARGGGVARPGCGRRIITLAGQERARTAGGGRRGGRLHRCCDKYVSVSRPACTSVYCPRLDPLCPACGCASSGGGERERGCGAA